MVNMKFDGISGLEQSLPKCKYETNHSTKSGSQKCFRGRPNILVGQPILVQPNITQPKHIIILFQRYDLEVDLFKKS